MDNFLKWFKEIMHVTVPGILYMCSLILLVILVIDKQPQIDSSIVKNNLLLISLFGFFISYIVGLSIHYAFQRIMWIIFPKDFKKQKKSIKNIKKIDEQPTRSRMIMFRHIFISFLLLGLLLLIYIKKNYNDFYIFSIIIIVIGLIIILLGYFYLRKLFILIKEKNE